MRDVLFLHLLRFLPQPWSFLSTGGKLPATVTRVSNTVVLISYAPNPKFDLGGTNELLTVPSVIAQTNGYAGTRGPGSSTALILVYNNAPAAAHPPPTHNINSMPLSQTDTYPPST